VRRRHQLRLVPSQWAGCSFAEEHDREKLRETRADGILERGKALVQAIEAVEAIALSGPVDARQRSDPARAIQEAAF
jgi:hypothetical protein